MSRRGGRGRLSSMKLLKSDTQEQISRKVDEILSSMGRFHTQSLSIWSKYFGDMLDWGLWDNGLKLKKRAAGANVLHTSGIFESNEVTRPLQWISNRKITLLIFLQKFWDNRKMFHLMSEILTSNKLCFQNISKQVYQLLLCAVI